MIFVPIAQFTRDLCDFSPICVLKCCVLMIRRLQKLTLVVVVLVLIALFSREYVYLGQVMFQTVVLS